MPDKEFDQLSMKEKYALQKIMKKQRVGHSLTEEEGRLFNKHRERWEIEEAKAKGKRPIIILLLVIGLFAIVKNCQ